MKRIVLLIVLLLVIISCKNEVKKEQVKQSFPNELAKVFEKHGGLDAWKSVRTLSFNKGEEVHTTDLWSRKISIKAPNYSLGFDGDSIWLLEKEPKAFKSNPKFYYNLYFYFYAMPFVLADDGITYEKIDDLIFEGKNYPGFKISYEADKGTSPDDNYIIYYNPENYQMEWLAYTVTFRSKKPSDQYNIIRYNDWNSENSLILPKSITWYKKDKNGIPTDPARAATEFTFPLALNKAFKNSFYQKPIE